MGEPKLGSPFFIVIVQKGQVEYNGLDNHALAIYNHNILNVLAYFFFCAPGLTISSG
jgi:uncharacterized membrane protein SpoIIM required for sporulation